MPKKAKVTAVEVVNKVLDREIITVDFLSMPLEARREWGVEAKAALNNRCIQHLIGKCESMTGRATSGEIARRCIENAVRYSRDHVETENIRHIIVGAELIRELLEEMLFTEDRSEPAKEPNSPM